MINTALGLSKLSRGKGERKGPFIQVVYDDKDLNELNFTEPLNNNLQKENKQKLNLPKTFTTRKGPLLLFSEDFSLDDFSLDPKIRNIELTKSLKTFGDLRKSILEFGINDDPLKHEYIPEFKQEDYMLIEGIRPGFSAKRYLSNWSRKWKPDLLENLAKEGRIKDSTAFDSYDSFHLNSKHRLEDDLSKIPPAYRIQEKWLSINIPALKGYRFYRVESRLIKTLKIKDNR